MSLEAVEEILGALLDISRLDAGATRPEISDVPVADLMRMLEVEFKPLAGSKGLELRFVPTKLAIRTDRRLMRRLLQNLVSNAIKYTLRGKVLVGCRRVPNALRIEVWDTGLGIPADRQRAVFEEFQRLDQGARVARGLGLGLSIVERLGRVLDHPVGLNSKPGEGSVFFVTAPLGETVPAQIAEAGAPELPSAGEPLAGLRVLAIDNEPRVLDGLRTLLGRWGCVVATAHGLVEAREALLSFGAPDLIIADYHLDQGDDGIAAIRALRETLGRALPAILATADRSPEARDEAARYDIVILHKPLKPAPLASPARPLQRHARGGGVGDKVVIDLPSSHKGSKVEALNQSAGASCAICRPQPREALLQGASLPARNRPRRPPRLRRYLQTSRMRNEFRPCGYEPDGELNST